MTRRVGYLSLALLLLAASLRADTAWKWSGAFSNRTVSLLIIGDIQVHSRRADPTTAFVNVRETLKAADLVYANLEGVLVDSGGPEGDIPDKKGWTHPGPGGVQALKDAGVDIVGLANNVAYGRNNILKTARLLKDNGVVTVGVGRNLDEAHKPAIVERKGVKIGFLQYTARWYREDEQLATATAAGAARITSSDGITIDAGDLARLQQDVRKLRPQVDIVIVSHHNRDGATPVQFGTQPARAPGAERPDRTRPEPYQRQFAQTALDAGADLVYGHGTHYVQGVEMYKGKPIVYAVGHSAFDQPGYEDSKDGLVLRAVIDGRNILRLSIVPVSRDAHNNMVMLDPTTGEGERLVTHVKERSTEVPLRVEEQEVVMIDRVTQTSRR
jgi:poly-gamma-glutamate capsule biosynthesis protein CapA/YwtB (metallophosphatase superfamily)